ncbi:GOLPH3/VPS74 family protein [Desulfitobacterium hafniense]|uniref:Golgi phosphoprotein 3-like protein n=4 Tax=root TaxID=1 RepID=Q24W50_DESHY|nr:GPP34 family phosphoprotein [Desulfitobacterium hafniense]EHL06547.1 hypothetical protein HMPREF0322_02817 [Desulfitobacterium hafniense DP7]KTE93178.1 hypothetical protein AT727_15730 [Desulfitobacterium hafniense]MEA5022274.1 GPP34 family phosphoprotein [Desulfitobacterium hafniense]CDX02031.1 Golgi phosphoprotein 3-like protein [Desulfitobacterium hafniense]BAE83742.1 hypothetical protein DSY1953 [Desulfitobacterium hafniense Y51]
MKSLSIAQEYVLCSLNTKGDLPPLSIKIPVCVVASGLIELLLSNCIKVNENKKLCVINGLGAEQVYLKSLFDSLNKPRPIEIKEIALEYNLSFTNKRLNALVADIGNSLADRDCVTIEKGGILGNESYFIPNPDEVDRVIQKIRAELLESGTVSDETVALASLLEEGNQIRNYFSKYELKQLNVRLKEIKKASSNQLLKQMLDYVDSFMIGLS